MNKITSLILLSSCFSFIFADIVDNQKKWNDQFRHEIHNIQHVPIQNNQILNHPVNTDQSREWVHFYKENYLNFNAIGVFALKHSGIVPHLNDPLFDSNQDNVLTQIGNKALSKADVLQTTMNIVTYVMAKKGLTSKRPVTQLITKSITIAAENALPGILTNVLYASAEHCFPKILITPENASFIKRRLLQLSRGAVTFASYGISTTIVEKFISNKKAA